MHRYIGLDIGKTKIAAGIVSENGVIESRMQVATKYGQGFDVIYAQCTQLLKKLIRNSDIKPDAMGIGTFGIINPEEGMILKSSMTAGRPNLKAAMLFEKELGISTRIENDVATAALGEHVFGAGKGYWDSTSLIIGTGAGIGIVRDNRIYHGKHFLAGQVGRIELPEGGALEERFSGNGIAKNASAVFKKDITTKDVFELAERGDVRAREVITTAVRNTAFMIVLIQNMIDPDVIILGGGVSAKQPRFVKRVKEAARGIGSVYDDLLNKKTNIRAALLGEDSVVIGAACLNMRK